VARDCGRGGGGFFGIAFLAILVQPVWLATVVLVAGLFGSGAVWILTVQGWRRRHPKGTQDSKVNARTPRQ
jgi:O-antigen/teichoic acid export membrane protein